MFIFGHFDIIFVLFLLLPLNLLLVGDKDLFLCLFYLQICFYPLRRFIYFFIKRSLLPSSQSHTIYTGEDFDKPGKMCEILALCGNSGSYSLHNFEDFILTPFGNPTQIGGAPLSPLVCDESMCKLGTDAPMSAIVVRILVGVRLSALHVR